ncbi:MAG: HNH endonuclease [Nitrospira sp. CG24C]|nr:MAG: HNH endonuclease [Nitrospira sp. CG24C]
MWLVWSIWFRSIRQTGREWSKSGETVLENLQTLCSVCNLGKSNVHTG